MIRKTEHITIEKGGLSDRQVGADDVARRLRESDLLMIFPEAPSCAHPVC